MDVEIIAVHIKKGIVIITGIDVTDENLRRLERLMDDAFEQEVEFHFDTHKKKDYVYLRKWLKQQKATEDSHTWGEALNSVVGTITTIAVKFRKKNWD